MGEAAERMTEKRGEKKAALPFLVPLSSSITHTCKEDFSADDTVVKMIQRSVGVTVIASKRADSPWMNTFLRSPRLSSLRHAAHYYHSISHLLALLLLLLSQPLGSSP